MPITFAAIDFESARLCNGNGDVPVQVGIAILNDGKIDRDVSWMSYIAPPSEVYRGSGLRDLNNLVDAPSLLSLWPKLRNSLQGRCVVAHGAGTEKRFLRVFPGHRFGPWLDTLRLSRAIYPTTPSHALGDLCKSLGLESEILKAGFQGTWHDALFDAAASLFLLRIILEETHIDPQDQELLATPSLEKYLLARKKKNYI